MSGRLFVELREAWPCVFPRDGDPVPDGPSCSWRTWGRPANVEPTQAGIYRNRTGASRAGHQSGACPVPRPTCWALTMDRRTNARHAWYLAFFEVIGAGWDFPDRCSWAIERRRGRSGRGRALSREPHRCLAAAQGVQSMIPLKDDLPSRTGAGGDDRPHRPQRARIPLSAVPRDELAAAERPFRCRRELPAPRSRRGCRQPDARLRVRAWRDPLPSSWTAALRPTRFRTSLPHGSRPCSCTVASSTWAATCCCASGSSTTTSRTRSATGASSSSTFCRAWRPS